MASRKGKETGILSYLGIAFIGYMVLNYVGGAAYNLMQFGRPRISFGRFTGTTIQATLTIPVTNGNPVGLPLDGLLGQVRYGNYTLLPFQLAAPISIAAGQTTDVRFNGQIRIAEIGGNIADIIASGQFLQSLTIVGEAYVKGAVIPFSNTISVG